MTEANDDSCPYIQSIKICLAWSNMRVCGHYRSRVQTPGVTQRISVRSRAARGCFGIDPHGHESDFCESVVFTIVL